MRQTAVLTSHPVATRRTFVGAGAAVLALGFCGALPDPALAADAGTPNILGPLPGYSPQIGTFVSQLTWLREMNGILRATEKLTEADLDYLFDKDANTTVTLITEGEGDKEVLKEVKIIAKKNKDKP